MISSSTVVNIINSDGTQYVPPTVNLPDNVASTALIIGVAFAGLVAVILIGVAVFFIVRRMRLRKLSRISPSPDTMKEDKLDMDEPKEVIQAIELANSSTVLDTPETSFEKWQESYIIPTSSRRKSRLRRNKK